jgi:hypothetical protein
MPLLQNESEYLLWSRKPNEETLHRAQPFSAQTSNTMPWVCSDHSEDEIPDPGRHAEHQRQDGSPRQEGAGCPVYRSPRKLDHSVAFQRVRAASPVGQHDPNVGSQNGNLHKHGHLFPSNRKAIHKTGMAFAWHNLVRKATISHLPRPFWPLRQDIDPAQRLQFYHESASHASSAPRWDSNVNPVTQLDLGSRHGPPRMPQFSFGPSQRIIRLPSLPRAISEPGRGVEGHIRNIFRSHRA